MNVTFRHGHIEATSYATSIANKVKVGKCDVIVVAASWDSRSTWITEIQDLSATKAIVVTYDKTDPDGRHIKNKQTLRTYLQERCESLEEVSGSSRDIEDLWSRIRTSVIDAAYKASTPIRICLDITAIPRFCSLAALANCIDAGIADQMIFLYADGIYEVPNTENEDYVFHEGEWRSVPVDSLEQMYDPARPICTVVSVGFEGSRTARVISEHEPDRIAVLFPDPGVRPEYVSITEEKNKDLLNEYLVPEEKIVRADAGDAIQAWKSLHIAGLERPEKENTFYLCCGTKPHALALGLRAMTTHLGTVLYYVSDSHRVTDIKAAERYWRYDIRDTSAFPRQLEPSLDTKGNPKH